MAAYFGKYRGRVEATADPEHRGRVQVSVPAVFGDSIDNWAEACTPYAGEGVGLYAVPPAGTPVWVEFERGDRDFPILSGALWCGQAPSTRPEVVVFRTRSVSLTMSDAQDGQGLSIEVAPDVAGSAMTLSMTSDGIRLSIGSSTISLTAETISLNDGALEVR